MVQLLFPRDPFAVREPDPAYAAEAAAADQLGIRRHRIDFESLVDEDDVERAVRQVTAQPEMVTAVYRGWMLRPAQYTALHGALADRNLRLVNTPAAYALTHELPNWHPMLAAWTPESVWLDVADALNGDGLSGALSTFGGGPIIVKDYVKSQKHRWDEACFIPNASDSPHVERVVRRFLELQGPDLHGGLVFRQFEQFERLARHSRSGMPLTREYRLFVLDGAVISCTPYWEEGEYDDAVAPPLDQIREAVARVESRFFTVDVARRDDGVWRIIELGDGQVAGLPERADPLAFYRAMLNQFGAAAT